MKAFDDYLHKTRKRLLYIVFILSLTFMATFTGLLFWIAFRKLGGT